MLGGLRPKDPSVSVKHCPRHVRRLVRCQEVAIDRLIVGDETPAAPPGADDTPGPGSIAAPVVSTSAPAEASATNVVSPPPAQPATSSPPVSPAPEPAEEPGSQASVEQENDKKPEPVFHGIVSRDDDRYPKEMETVDGIIVKVLDTDEDPLDADMEIRVGDTKTKYEDRPVGSRLGGWGLSRKAYAVVITRIDDDQETVHFAVEPVGGRK